jgi:hypothetical protein
MGKPRPALVSRTLRITKDLDDRITRAADSRHATVATEIRLRLEDSFTIHAQRALSEIARDIEINWLTFSERLHLNALEEDLAKALARTNDPEVKRLARTWLLSRRDVLPKVEP